MRLFIAVNFSEDFKNSLLRYQSELQKYAAPHEQVNWTTPQNLHLTLAFIGEYPEPKNVRAALDKITFAPFSIQLGRCGNFGSLWWVGLDNGDKAVALSNQIRSELQAAQIPYDKKPLKPHVTLAREFYPAAPPHIRPIKAETLVQRVSLMRSERIRGKITYTEIGRTPS